MIRFLRRVILTFNPASRLDWVLFWLMIYLILLTWAGFTPSPPPTPPEYRSGDYPGLRN